MNESLTLTADLAGNITQETAGGSTRSFTYVGDRLATMTKAGSTTKFHYDAEGNLDCSTTDVGSRSDCNTPEGASASTKLIADYSYDYLNRLAGFRSYISGTLDDSASYTHDALDRVVEQVESHGGGQPRSTTMGYLGLSRLLTDETHKNASGQTTATKSFTHDVWGNLMSMVHTPQGGPVDTYTFARDVHGSISLLVNSAGDAAASYAYTPYGTADLALTKDDEDTDSPLNPFRYTGKRFDSGSQTLDMGARHFEPGAGRFLQQDVLLSAAADLGLSLSPLGANRYALAGGNPLSYVEIDGHVLIADGGGGAARSPRRGPRPGIGRHDSTTEFREAGIQEARDLRTEYLISQAKRLITMEEPQEIRDVMGACSSGSGDSPISSMPYGCSSLLDTYRLGITAYGGLFTISDPMQFDFTLDPEGEDSGPSRKSAREGLGESLESVGDGGSPLRRFWNWISRRGSAARPVRSLDDPQSLRGATPKEILELIPQGWTARPLKRGPGVRFHDPARTGEAIFIELGFPHARSPLHRGPYVKISHHGKIVRVPLAGNPTLGSAIGA